jgi:membrane protein DedA with SNARE-associated domain
MDLPGIIENYGYAAILVGTFLEGETILILAGFAAHLGYLNLPLVMLAAFLGSLCGDQLYFYLGRKHSYYILRRKPVWEQRIAKFNRLLERYHTLLILSFRFLYGLRTVSPFAMGMSSVSTARFVALNAIGAIVWAVSFGIGGYFFGQALELLIGDLKKYEYILLGTIALAGIIIWGIYFLWRKKKRSD